MIVIIIILPLVQQSEIVETLEGKQKSIFIPSNIGGGTFQTKTHES